MRIDYEDFQQAVELIGFVPKKSSMPASELVRLSGTKGGLLMQASVSHATGFARAKVSEGTFPKDSLYVSKDALVHFASVTSSAKKPYKVVVEDNAMRISCQRNHLKFQAKPPIQVSYGPQKTSGKKVQVNSHDATVLNVVRSFACQDSSVAHVHCVGIKKGLAFASDRISAAVARLDMKDTIFLPLLSAGLVERASAFYIDDNQVFVEFGVGTKRYGLLRETVPAETSRFPFKPLWERMQEASKLPLAFHVRLDRLNAGLRDLRPFTKDAKKNRAAVKLQVKEGKLIMTTNGSESFRTSVDVRESKSIMVDASVSQLLQSMAAAQDIASHVALYYKKGAPLVKLGIPNEKTKKEEATILLSVMQQV